MLCERRSPMGVRPNPAVIRLTQADVPEMLALTKLTNPGPFGSRTHEMGDYFGIRIGETLAAMAGERLKLPGYTEISAVCTHADHHGHGYASVLIATLIDRIFNRGEQPHPACPPREHSRHPSVRAPRIHETRHASPRSPSTKPCVVDLSEAPNKAKRPRFLAAAFEVKT
jgi:GNAT superfamily N-acetyltransferase